MASLANKTALVTGASRGIGRATAEALAKMGAHLIVHYGRSAAEADAVVAGIRAAGGSADAAQADLSMPEGAAALAKQVRAIVGQRLDIFVANAGVSKAAAIEEHTIEDFDNLFATNVRSPFFLVKELLALFGEGSSIIVVSSLAARAAPGNPGQAVYAYPSEHYGPWAERLGYELSPGNFGENLTTQGLLEDAVHIGDE